MTDVRPFYSPQLLSVKRFRDRIGTRDKFHLLHTLSCKDVSCKIFAKREEKMPYKSDLIFWSTFEFYAPKLSAAVAASLPERVNCLWRRVSRRRRPTSLVDPLRRRHRRRYRVEKSVCKIKHWKQEQYESEASLHDGDTLRRALNKPNEWFSK